MKQILSTGIFKGFLILMISTHAIAQPSVNNNYKGTGTINITSFNIYAKENQLCFDWATDCAITTNVFEVQQSNDGINFSTVALVLGPDPKQQGDNYACSYLFKNKKKHTKYYYRLRHVDTEGNEQLGTVKELIELTKDETCKK